MSDIENILDQVHIMSESDKAKSVIDYEKYDKRKLGDLIINLRRHHSPSKVGKGNMSPDYRYCFNCWKAFVKSDALHADFCCYDCEKTYKERTQTIKTKLNLPWKRTEEFSNSAIRDSLGNLVGLVQNHADVIIDSVNALAGQDPKTVKAKLELCKEMLNRLQAIVTDGYIGADKPKFIDFLAQVDVIEKAGE